MVEQMTLDIPHSPERIQSKNSEWFQTFTLDTNEADAVAKFKRRFGYEPERISRRFGLLWSGPVEA